MSCSLFSETPQNIINGQRSIYDGILIVEENIQEIIDIYERDNKMAVSYHINYILELELNKIRLSQEISDFERQTNIEFFQKQRDKEMRDAFASIEKNANNMRRDISRNIRSIKQLTESIYNYLSATSLSVDAIPILIDRVTNDKRK